MILTVTLQIFSRFLLESTPSWTEEAARAFFIYTIAFGVGSGIQNGSFVRLELIHRYLKEESIKILDATVWALVVVFMGISSYYAWVFLQYGFDETSPAMEIPMAFVFAGLFILMVMMLIFSIDVLIRILFNPKK
ncbi:MAG: TRAP transporter small permease [Cyclobacteriaceae bacterium]|nr:TRAP transporter small permease [Cyclobacteriaceae bacterium]